MVEDKEIKVALCRSHWVNANLTDASPDTLDIIQALKKCHVPIRVYGSEITLLSGRLELHSETLDKIELTSTSETDDILVRHTYTWTENAETKDQQTRIL